MAPMRGVAQVRQHGVVAGARLLERSKGDGLGNGAYASLQGGGHSPSASSSGTIAKTARSPTR